jgi:hypothetical protein
MFIVRERTFTYDMFVNDSLWSKNQHKQSGYHSVTLNNNNGNFLFSILVVNENNL